MVSPNQIQTLILNQQFDKRSTGEKHDHLPGAGIPAINGDVMDP